ncbi:hypothetical protein PBY51_019036 [Eleginops maclovinus]|uniref:Uncharacterized protein n=1 Tax=Eleginops maclovinus TaxID=56733 RepID=A0AAN7Y5C3_ELEMC|nr:hypothetical protein PBY51_019036 [Eleginops maclovinus]
MKDSQPNGWTYIFVLKHRANFQALCDKESKGWRYGWMVRSQMEVSMVSGLSYGISGRCGGEVKVRMVTGATPGPVQQHHHHCVPLVLLNH